MIILTKENILSYIKEHVPSLQLKEAGGALYLQSALVGVISCPGLLDRELPCISGIDVWVLRNRNL